MDNKCEFCDNGICNKNGPNAKVYVDFYGMCSAGDQLKCPSFEEKMYQYPSYEAREAFDKFKKAVDNIKFRIGVSNV